jgi:hypothetical protein
VTSFLVIIEAPVPTKVKALSVVSAPRGGLARLAMIVTFFLVIMEAPVPTKVKALSVVSAPRGGLARLVMILWEALRSRGQGR